MHHVVKGLRPRSPKNKGTQTDFLSWADKNMVRSIMQLTQFCTH